MIVHSQQQHTMKLTCLPHSVTERKVFKFLQEHKAVFDMTSIKVFNGYSLVNYGCKVSCERACSKLNGKAMERMLVKAKVKGSSSTTSTVHTVKINHLSPTVTEEDLHKLCSPFGEISSIKVNNLYAYVNLVDEDAAMNVLKYLNGRIKVGGQTVTASIHYGAHKCHSTSPSKESCNATNGKSAPVLPVGPSCTVKVTLNKPLSNEDLLQYFSSFGTIEGAVKVHSGSPDFAYVNFSSPREANMACKEKTVTFKNVTLTIKLSNKSKSIHALELNNGFVDQLLVRSNDLEEKLSKFNVSIDDEGSSIKGSAGDISRANVLLKSLRETVEAKLVKKSKRFHYCAIPLLLDVQVFESLSRKHCVEFEVRRTDGKEEDVAVFCDMFARHRSKPRILSKVDLFSSYTKATQSFTWYYKDEHGVLTPINQTDSDCIEDCYQSYCTEEIAISTYTHYNGMTCEYDFSRMIETNLDLEKDKKIVRETKEGSKGITLLCRGYEEATSAALSELESAISAQYRITVVDITDSKYARGITDLVSQYCVELLLPQKFPGQISLKGEGQCVEVASIDIKVKLEEMKCQFPPSFKGATRR